MQDTEHMIMISYAMQDTEHIIMIRYAIQEEENGKKSSTMSRWTDFGSKYPPVP